VVVKCPRRPCSQCAVGLFLTCGMHRCQIGRAVAFGSPVLDNEGAQCRMPISAVQHTMSDLRNDNGERATRPARRGKNPW